MIITAFHGLCMALADSVPGVSGVTIAFILGFYDRFLDSIHDLFGRDKARRRAALSYLLRLGIGWVVGITLLRGHTSALGSVSFAGFAPLSLLYIFLAGAVAITAMVLPGISGSSVLLIAGVYLPAIQAVHSLMGLQLSVLPGLCALGLGVLAGAALSIGGIRKALQLYRSQMVWLILDLMLGSAYAIVNGPASLSTPLPPMNLTSFRWPAFLLSIVLLLALELLKQAWDRLAALRAGTRN